MVVMLMMAFFSWWYGRGWREVAVSFKPRVRKVLDSFSVGLLLPTLFAPWRRIITQPGRNLEDRWRAWVDNMFSRVIGFFVRIFVLFAALIVLAGVVILTAIEVVIWPLLPLAIPGFIVAGLMV